MSDHQDPQPQEQASSASLPTPDKRAHRRRMAGTSMVRTVDGGAPSRTSTGDWMQRIALDLPEAMLDTLNERAEKDEISTGEVVRAALVAAGMGDPSHVTGICDGTYADDADRAEAEASRRQIYIQVQERLPGMRSQVEHAEPTQG